MAVEARPRGQRTPMITRMTSWQITVLFFARSRELAGVSSVRTSVSANISAVGLLNHVVALYPAYVHVNDDGMTRWSCIEFMR